MWSCSHFLFSREAISMILIGFLSRRFHVEPIKLLNKWFRSKYFVKRWSENKTFTYFSLLAVELIRRRIYEQGLNFWYIIFSLPVCISKILWLLHTRTQLAVTCSKLTIEMLEQGVNYVQICQWRRSGVFIVNFEHISHLVLLFLLLTLNK